MLHSRTVWLTSVLCVLVVLPGLFVGAGEKKKDEPKAGGVVFNKFDSLTEDDEKDTHPDLKNSFRKVHKLKLIQGKTYQIELKSIYIDSVLRLENAAGKEVAFNDDAEGGNNSLDSLIRYTAPKTEEYKIIATCLDGKLTGRRNVGRFTLTVIEVGGAAKVGGEGGSTASIFKGKSAPLELKGGKARFEGALNADMAQVFQGHFYHLFTVKLEAGKSYRIDHKSDDFDAFLFLEDAAGKTLLRDDDGGEGLNSRIFFKADKTAEFRIAATSLLAKQMGNFTLEIKPAAGAAEEKEAAFFGRFSRLDSSKPAEQKETIKDGVARLQARGEKLNANDAQLAMQLGTIAEDVDSAFAKDTYGDLIKVFSAAEDKKLANVSRAFESARKKLGLLGKTLEITGTTVDGKEFDLKNLKGKVVLVDFWATWCGPCIAELPNMESAYKKYHGKGFDIIGVSLDRNDDAITKFNEARKLPWPSINVEDSRKLADRYEVNAIPFPVLVDAQGRVVSLRARGPQLERLLEKMLGEKK